METYENIKFFREKLGLSQEDLAIKVGYKDRSSIAKIEAGLVDLTQSKIIAFAEALHVSPFDLMGVADDPLAKLPADIPIKVEHIGIRIRERRKARRLSMKQLGDALGLAESTISQYEKGNRRPAYETLLRISEFFCVSVGYLLGTEDNTPSTNEDAELNELSEMLKTRPECRMLAQLLKDTTKDDIEKIIRIVEILREN